jgi:hypothetical protein
MKYFPLRTREGITLGHVVERRRQVTPSCAHPLSHGLGELEDIHRPFIHSHGIRDEPLIVMYRGDLPFAFTMVMRGRLDKWLVCHRPIWSTSHTHA